MVLSNAERQKRFRQRLKARADGADLSERVRTLLLDAFEVIASGDGYLYDAEGEPIDAQTYIRLFFQNAKSIKAHGQPAKQFEDMVRSRLEDDLSDEQRETLERALQIMEAVNFRLVKRLSRAALGPQPRNFGSSK